MNNLISLIKLLGTNNFFKEHQFTIFNKKISCGAHLDLLFVQFIDEHASCFFRSLLSPLIPGEGSQQEKPVPRWTWNKKVWKPLDCYLSIIFCPWRVSHLEFQSIRLEFLRRFVQYLVSYIQGQLKESSLLFYRKSKYLFNYLKKKRGLVK